MTPWTVAHQAPLSMGFSKQQYWSGLPFLPPGEHPHSVIEHVFPVSPTLAGRFFFFFFLPLSHQRRPFSLGYMVNTYTYIYGGSSVISNSLQPIANSPPGFSPWDFLVKNTCVGYYFFLQRVFPTQGSNPGLLHFRWILYRLRHLG